MPAELNHKEVYQVQKICRDQGIGVLFFLKH